MKRIKLFFTDSSKTVYLHAFLIFVWVLLIIPTLLFWANSILWVLVISIYANIVGHWSAYQAASSELSERSGLDNEDLDKKLDEILERLNND